MIGGMTNSGRIKRIAVVVPKYGLVGGGEKFVYEATERIAADRRWEIHVFSNRWRKGSDLIHFHHVPMIRFPRFLRPLSFALFAQRKINRVGVDLIHTHERILRAQIYSVHGIPHSIWVKQIRRKSYPSLFDFTLARIEKKLIEDPKCKYLLAVSSLTEEKLKMAFTNAADRIRVITPGIDIRPFELEKKQHCRDALRRKYGWGENDIVLLFVGMNFEVKGLEATMKAMGHAVKNSAGRPLRLLVVGKGNSRKFSQIAESLGIAKQVAFAGVIESNIEKVYLACDVFILLSQFDTFGLVVLEAMAAGLPVIISKTVGAMDVVRNGANGFVVDADDIEEVADKIVDVSDEETRIRMGKEAIKTSRSHSWEAMANKVISIYETELL